MRLPDPTQKNRSWWNRSSDWYQSAHGKQLSDGGEAWGVWSIPESELRVLGDVEGRHVLELGCGAAEWSIALARRGARAVGLDLSERQLAHAQRIMADAGLKVPLVNGSAEQTPYRDGSFDLIFCDHGAMTFARPEKTVAEASRLLRPGGLFVFNMSSPIRDMCLDPRSDTVGRELIGDYDSLHRFEDEESIEFQLTHGEWIRLFRRHSLLVEDLIEIRPPPGARTSYQDYVSTAWARRWPAENIWKLSKVKG